MAQDKTQQENITVISIQERREQLSTELDKANKEIQSLTSRLEQIKTISVQIVGAITLCDELISQSKEKKT